MSYLFGRKRAERLEEGIEEYVLSGFDPSGEPQIRRTATGRLWLAIEYRKATS